MNVSSSSSSERTGREHALERLRQVLHARPVLRRREVPHRCIRRDGSQPQDLEGRCARLEEPEQVRAANSPELDYLEVREVGEDRVQERDACTSSESARLTERVQTYSPLSTSVVSAHDEICEFCRVAEVEKKSGRRASPGSSYGWEVRTSVSTPGNAKKKGAPAG